MASVDRYFLIPISTPECNECVTEILKEKQTLVNRTLNNSLLVVKTS